VPNGRLLPDLLKRQRAIVLSALALLCALAWLYLLRGAGFGTGMRGRAALAFIPSGRISGASNAMAMADRGIGSWDGWTWCLVVAMWAVMMVAMMIPSATPAILLYDRIRRRHGGSDDAALAPTGAFAAGYLLAWLFFACAAAVLQWGLEREGFVSRVSMGFASQWLAGGILIAAGLYQFSPLKNACLSHCRAPAHFFTRHWRPHPGGALRLGTLHGAFCVGCCWMLMLLLFVGGVMDLAWIAFIACLVSVERTVPKIGWLGKAGGMLLLAWGLVTLVASPLPK
jgi:predicted metal-binding membrane protein